MLSFTPILGHLWDVGWKPFHILSTSRRHHEAFEMLTRILIGTDGSEGATSALRVAVDLAAANSAELVVLNVLHRDEPKGARGQELLGFAAAEHLSGGHVEAREILALAEARAIVASRGGLRASFVCLGGDAAEEILRYADAVQADVIVVGRGGRGRLTGMLLGSVSQKVTSLARQPVLIVPTGR